MNRPAGVTRAEVAAAGRTSAPPWWLRAMPWLGDAPALTREQWRLLGVVGAANLFDNYGSAILGLALPQIQSGLGVAEGDVGWLIGVVRLGVIPALLFTALADSIGRRRLLLVTILGYTTATFLTAFSRDVHEFMLLQFVARVFIAAESMLAIVVIAEEFDAGTRGWGIGMLGALGTLGHGVAAIIFAVVNLLPFGWRALYVIGVLPLLLLAWFRRSLTETRRFTLQHAHRARGGVTAVLQPFRSLVRMYPGRMLALCAALLPMAFITETAMTFVSKSLQEVHGYTPAHVAALFLTVGVVAPIGNVIAGRLGDRFGRKPVMLVGLAVNAVATALFYNTHGFWIPPVWGLMLVTLELVAVLFAALGSELFPTSYRSTASGVRAVVATLGGSIGLWTEGVLYGRVGSHAAAITWLLVAAPIAPAVVAAGLRETANQELEDIAPER